LPIPLLHDASWRQIWLRPIGIGLLGSLLFGFMNLLQPRSGQIVGAVIMPGRHDAALVAMLRSDPDLRLVEDRRNSRVIFVVYRRPDFPDVVRNSGVLFMFEANAAGCHFAR